MVYWCIVDTCILHITGVLGKTAIPTRTSMVARDVPVKPAHLACIGIGTVLCCAMPRYVVPLSTAVRVFLLLLQPVTLPQTQLTLSLGNTSHC